MNDQLEKDFLGKVDSLRGKVNVLHFSCGRTRQPVIYASKNLALSRSSFITIF
ncbi:MAG: hypothetical protein LBH43_11010 [Treponema sp.]|jgi:hypothetical protein|nr:hypothetical protein [Treponema sp.]